MHGGCCEVVAMD